MDDQRRSGAWDVLKWLEWHRPSWLVVENVREFRGWGPLNDANRPLGGKRGQFFDAWLMAIRAAGYQVDHRLLNAADFGAATSRTRLFVVARKGNRCPVWPEPSHRETPGGELPGMSLPKWRAAAEVIDWTLPLPSIFSRKRPLADKTLRRIEIGLRKFCGPYIVQFDQQGGSETPRAIDRPLGTMVTKGSMGLACPFVVKLKNNATVGDVADPLNTITAGVAHHALACPFQYQLIGRGAGRSRDINDPVPTIIATRENQGVICPFLVPNFGERGGQTPRTHDLAGSLPAVTGHGAGALVCPFLFDVNHGGTDGRTFSIGDPLGVATTKRGKGIACPFVSAFHNGSDGERRNYSIGDPLPTQDTSNRYGLCLPFLAHYYGTDNMSPLDEPVDTITAKQRHSLIVARFAGHPPDEPGDSDAMRSLKATMRELGIYDIGFRMLANHELAAAQGFGSSYIFHGCKADVTRQIGNSVSPNVAEALTRAICA